MAIQVDLPNNMYIASVTTVVIKSTLSFHSQISQQFMVIISTPLCLVVLSCNEMKWNKSIKIIAFRASHLVGRHLYHL